MNVTLLNVLRRFVNCSRRGSGPLVIQVKWRNKRETNERRIKKKWNNFHICNNGIQLYLWSHFATYKCISYCELYSHNFPIPFGSFFLLRTIYLLLAVFVYYPSSIPRTTCATIPYFRCCVYTTQTAHIFFRFCPLFLYLYLSL